MPLWWMWLVVMGWWPGRRFMGGCVAMQTRVWQGWLSGRRARGLVRIRPQLRFRFELWRCGGLILVGVHGRSAITWSGRGWIRFRLGRRSIGVAPPSPTTTGKEERFHKTSQREPLADRRLGSQGEADEVIDGWMVEYNTVRPHHGIAIVPPIRRFELAEPEPFEVVIGDDQPEVPEPAEMVVEEPRRVTRKVGQAGRISLANFRYHVGRWLAGETVDVAIAVDGLVEISHRGVLVATHARQHSPEAATHMSQRSSVIV